METDYHLLMELSSTDKPILHFYDWKFPSITYGHFLVPEKYINLQIANQNGIDLAKRPTGGGVTFHMSDFAYSVIVPATHPKFSTNPKENYAFINTLVAKAIQSFATLLEEPRLCLEVKKSRPSTYCMAEITQYDIVIGEKKVGGAAQRRTRSGFLHQGSVFLTPPPKNLLDQLVSDSTYIPVTSTLIDHCLSLKKTRLRFKKHLINAFLSKHS